MDINKCLVVIALLLLFPVAALLNLSCGEQGNATAAEREQLLRAVREYWENGRDYSLGFTSGVGELAYAEVEGDGAEVVVEIITGYTQPTDGAGYKQTDFRLRRTANGWEVTYDGWADKEVSKPLGSELKICYVQFPWQPIGSQHEKEATKTGMQK